jgi:type 1 glutamine amidotransferase
MPIIDHHATIRVLAAVRGHPFDRMAFAALFDGMEGVSVTFVDQPAAGLLMRPDLADHFDVLLLYDMPGIDFTGPVAGAPVDPPEALRTGLAALLTRGIGVVALHHAIAGWPAWPQYAEWLGGAFLYRTGELRGRAAQDSGYRHEVRYTASLSGAHPVTGGLPSDFPMVDELYLAEVFADAVTPLLTSDHGFVAENFWSATHAIEGRMFSNAGWQHPPGSDLIGWVKRAEHSPLVYLQPGDDAVTYQNPNYRRLVENAIRWTASAEARAWAQAPA